MLFVLNHTCTIEREVALGTNGRRQLSSVHTNVPSVFLPMSAQSAIENNFTVGTGFDVFFEDGTDVQVGDRLTWNGQTYFVRGRKVFTMLSAGVNHIQVAATTEHANGV